MPFSGRCNHGRSTDVMPEPAGIRRFLEKRQEQEQLQAAKPKGVDQTLSRTM